MFLHDTGNIYALRVNMSVAVVAMVKNYTVVVNGTDVSVSRKRSIEIMLLSSSVKSIDV